MVKRLLTLLLLVIGVMAMPSPAQAMACTSDLVGCYARASQMDGWLDRWAAGMDCEIGYAGCVRRAIWA